MRILGRLSSREVGRNRPSIKLACSCQVMDREGEVEGGRGLDAPCTRTEVDGNGYAHMPERRMAISHPNFCPTVLPAAYLYYCHLSLRLGLTSCQLPAVSHEIRDMYDWSGFLTMPTFVCRNGLSCEHLRGRRRMGGNLRFVLEGV